MTATTRHDLRSVTKSIVSALVGQAVAEGAISSLDRPVVDWFREFADLQTAERRRVTLRHVLGMTAGLAWNEDVPDNDPRNDEIRTTADDRPLHCVLSRPFAVEPGTDFTSNGGLTQVAAAVIERATKMSLETARSRRGEDRRALPSRRQMEREAGAALGTRIPREHVVEAVASGSRRGRPGA
jgi:CubicO group peptidase (beta-lactamase class C family)